MKYINETGFRVCLKGLYETKYDPLSVSYAVLSGIVTRIILNCNFPFYSLRDSLLTRTYVFLQWPYLTNMAKYLAFHTISINKNHSFQIVNYTYATTNTKLK